MKIKVIVLSFLITTFLSLNFVIPQLISEHLQVYLADMQRSATQYGLKLDFEDVRLSYIPMRIRINKVHLENRDGDMIFSTDKIEFSRWSFAELINMSQGEMSISDLSQLKVALQQLEFNDVYLSPQLRSVLSSLGYNRLVMNIVSDYKYEVDSKEFFLNELSVEGSNMGKINLQMHLKDFVFPEKMDIKNMNGFNESSIKSFSIEYVDDSLMKNIKLMAEKNNIPMDNFLAFTKRIEGNRDPASTGDNEITQGLQKFVNDPKSVKIEATPEKEIPFKDISLMLMLSPAKLIESLQPSLVINGAEVSLDKIKN